MKKEDAIKVVKLLEESKGFNNNCFEVEKELLGEHLEGFHQWVDFKKHLRSFLLRRNETKTALWLVFNEWNPNQGYYLIVFPENKQGPLIEIQRVNRQDFEWKYKPSKRDGLNEARKDYFTKYFGSIEVRISIPSNEEEVIGFVEDIFQLTEIRIKSDDLSDDLPTERDVFKEGRRVEKKHFARERNSKLIAFVKDQFKKSNGNLSCQICEFNFEETYGERGKDFIEAHHTRPLSELDVNGEETKPEEIILVCPNCHRMIHKTRPWLKADELKKVLK